MLDFNYESRGEPLLSRSAFLGRLAGSGGAAAVLISISLFAGMCGYKYLEDMTWVDAFVNAAMILSGMGPVGELHTTAGKILAGCYAIFSGLIIVIATGFVLAPIFHRVLHSFHVEERGDI